MLACRQLETYRAIFELLGPAADRVLDLGCNVAVLGQLLRHWGFTGAYTGLDSNPHAVTRARHDLPNGNFWVANARSLPLASHTVARVVIKDVLEHLEDFRPALREAARVARDLLVVGCYIPWGVGPAAIVRHRHGFFENRYCRSEVLDDLAACGWRLWKSRKTREQDGRENEVLAFVPTQSWP